MIAATISCASNPAINGRVTDAVRKFRVIQPPLDHPSIPTAMSMTLKADPSGLQP
jgi:hypothetical protein